MFGAAHALCSLQEKQQLCTALGVSGASPSPQPPAADAASQEAHQRHWKLPGLYKQKVTPPETGGCEWMLQCSDKNVTFLSHPCLGL